MRFCRRSWQIKSLVAATAIMLTCVGCVSYESPVKPPGGILFTDVRAPLTIDFEDNAAGAAITKVSHKQTYWVWDYILTGINIAWDSAKVDEIARSKGIERVSYADYGIRSILGLYAVYTVNIYGN